MKPQITCATACTGIGAFEVACDPLGWRQLWCSEIAPAPIKVLSHHRPQLPNHGDMLGLADKITKGAIEAPDVFCAGTPCQSFSVAGMRLGMSDPRGRLTIEYIRICDAIDAVRRGAGKSPAVHVWENVPGAGSDRGNAFGCLLAGLAGGDEAIEPGPRPEQGRRSSLWRWNKKAGCHFPSWSDAGCVYGPVRTVAWRVFDAQYFELAQQRRRYLIVACDRSWADPSALLFEFDRLRRDFAPRREKGEEITHPVAGCLRGSGTGSGRIGDATGHDTVVAVPDLHGGGGGAGRGNGLDRGPVMAMAPGHPIQTVATPASEVQGAVAGETYEIAPTLDASGVGFSRVGFSRVGDIRGQDPVIAVFGGNRTSGPLDCAPALNAGAQSRCDFETEALIVGSLQANGKAAGSATQQDAENGHLIVCVTGEIAHALKAEGADGSEDGTGRGTPIVACVTGEVTHPLTCAHSATEDGGGRGIPIIGEPYTIAVRGRGHESSLEYRQDGTANAVLTPTGGRGGVGVGAVAYGLRVRRLMPWECELLQGFPKHYTRVPVKWDADGKPLKYMADGPRYKCLGNSMAVPKMRWVAMRVGLAIELMRGRPV